MLELFRMEAEVQLEQLENGLLQSEKGATAATFESMMRAAHSLKGAARIVGVRSAEKVAHSLEDCLVAAQEGRLRLDPVRVDRILPSLDFIARSSRISDEELADWESGSQEELKAILANLASLLEPESEPLSEAPVETRPASRSETASPPLLPPSTMKASAGVAEEQPESPSPTPPEDTPASSRKDSGQRQEGTGKRTLRMAADRLDSLLGLAGEAQVASAWLSDYCSNLLRLKARQSELSRKLSELAEALRDGQSGAAVESRLQGVERLAADCSSGLLERMETLSGFDRRVSRLSSRLHGEIVSSRMRPFSDLSVNFPRQVRDLARTLGKELVLEIHGPETLVDRDILDRLESPLLHLLRNAADHGIEFPDNRLAADKPSHGTIRLRADHRGGMVCLEVEDDGYGIDHEKLRAVVVRKGLSSAEMAQRLSDDELEQFLFLPGFTSKSHANEISGRGVGLDLVRSAIVELGGQIHLESRPGQGVKFQLILPLTLSVVQCLKVSVDGEPYAFPLSRLESVLEISYHDIEELEGRYYLRSQEAPLVSLRQVLQVGGYDPPLERIPVVMIGYNRRRFALAVDALQGEGNLVVHRLDPRLGKIPNVSSAAILDDGWPALILDVDDLARNIERMLESSSGTSSGVNRPGAEAEPTVRKRVLLVEDSITVREVERQLLEGMGLEVEIAVDGADGWNAARQRDFDLIISDIDMPRMNGIELVGLIKSDPRLRATPVMIVSYKDREEDRQRGLEAGADFFLSKGSFHDHTLVEAVKELIP